jgi:transposase-like protein
VNGPKQSERRELWRQRIAQQEESGQSVRAFCREHELKEHSFYSWRKQLGSSTGTPIRFALVETPAAGPGRRQEPLELVLSSGERLHIPADAATLRLVLGVLRERE